MAKPGNPMQQPQEIDSQVIATPMGDVWVGRKCMPMVVRHPSGAVVHPHMTLWVHAQTEYLLMSMIEADDGITVRAKATLPAEAKARALMLWLIAQGHVPSWVSASGETTRPSQGGANG